MEGSQSRCLKEKILIAYGIENTRRIRSQQIGVPIPVREECMPENLEALAKALEAHGDFQKAEAVRRHARGYFWLFKCPNGHTWARPDSCGNHLCPWCRRHLLKGWAKSLAERAGCETNGYAFQVLFELNSGSVDSVKTMLRKSMHRNGGSPAFGFVPVRDNLWKLVGVVTGLNATGLDESLSTLQGFALMPQLASLCSFPLNELAEN